MFREQVINFIKKVPRGKVISYGQVAAACGKPNGAREVGRILRSIDSSAISIPWWRVINNRGEISIKANWTATKQLQKELLMGEGVQVSSNFTIDMKKYRY